MHLERLQLFGEDYALSHAVIAGNVVHVAGMVGMEISFTGPPSTPPVFPDGIEAQMRLAYRNIAHILERVDARITDIASQTLYFTGDAAEAQAANRVVRHEVFGPRPPASAMVEVAGLFHPACRLEIQAVAYRRAG